MSIPSAWRLDGRIALITGAARGIGAAIARQYLQAGARLVLVDRDGEALASVARDTGGLAVVADIAEPAAAGRAFEALDDAHGGRLDILVNNAAVAGVRKPLVEMTLAEFDGTLAVNLGGAVRFAKAAVPRLVRSGGGVILNLTTRGTPIHRKRSVRPWRVSSV